MSRYIISERWSFLMQNADTSIPYVQPGISTSPIPHHPANYLSSEVYKDQPPNSEINFRFFKAPDVTLIKRLRLWSPCAALGLVGGVTIYQGAPGFDLRLFSASETTETVGDIIEVTGPMALGEWIDVNQTVSSRGMPLGERYQLRTTMRSGLTLDASRMTAALVGSGNVSQLSFELQVDLAHTLQADYV